MRNFKKNTERARRLRENGCRVMVTRRIEGKEIVIEERVVTPEEIAESNAQRDNNLIKKLV